MHRGYLATLALAATLPALAQTAAISTSPKRAPPAARTTIPDYPGVQTRVPGVWLPPVANAPFTATVEILTHEKLPDGTERIRTTTNHIARSSSGRIYNERRQLVPTTYTGLPILLASHTYDPATRLSVTIDPRLHLARQMVLPHPAPVIAGRAPIKINPNPGAGRTEVDLGTQTVKGFTLQGIRRTRAIAGALSDTGQPLTIVDEYWFSPDLTTYFIIKHNDPRTGEQIITLNDIQRAEPDAALFTIPSSFKIVDETPPDLPEYE